jgi:hypothetical protein
VPWPNHCGPRHTSDAPKTRGKDLEADSIEKQSKVDCRKTAM